MKGIFPGFRSCRKFCTGTLIGIFTVGLADGRMDVTDEERTVGQMVGMITSRVGSQKDES